MNDKLFFFFLVATCWRFLDVLGDFTGRLVAVQLFTCVTAVLWPRLATSTIFTCIIGNESQYPYFHHYTIQHARHKNAFCYDCTVTIHLTDQTSVCEGHSYIYSYNSKGHHPHFTVYFSLTIMYVIFLLRGNEKWANTLVGDSPVSGFFTTVFIGWWRWVSHIVVVVSCESRSLVFQPLALTKRLKCY
jgi:hypothetical protein